VKLTRKAIAEWRDTLVLEENGLNKLRTHLEMLTLNVESNWSQLPGQPAGLEYKTLDDDLDEENRTGSRSRLVRFAPGVSTNEVFVHEYWEEVLLIAGDLTKVDDSPAPDGVMTYSLRPPGTRHGPFISRNGCLLFEVHSFLKY
jgi:hypothetical protein